MEALEIILPMMIHHLILCKSRLWRLPIEQKVLAAGALGIRVIIIRPAMVYGHTGGVLGGMVNDAGKDGFIRYVGNGENRWAMVHVDDLARLYIAAMEHAPSGVAFAASDGKALQVRKIAELLSHQAGIPGSIKRMAIGRSTHKTRCSCRCVGNRSANQIPPRQKHC